MAYQLNSGAAVGAELRRIAREELESAARALLGATAKSRDEAIHAARKSIKKTRALLRLIDEKNERLRDAGRTLSEYRDAAAMIETFDDLRKEYGDSVDRRTWTEERRALVKSKKERDAASGLKTVLAGVAKTLQSEARASEKWAFRDEIAPGLKETYRRGRKALRAVKKDPAPEKFHEWRKRVKDHWYHLRLLGNVAEREKEFKKLETWLGDDHNLMLLQEKVGDEVGKAIGRYSADLREKAVELGERLYAERPRQFVGGLGRAEALRRLKPAPHGVPNSSDG